MVPKVGRVIFLMANVVKRGKLIIKKGLQRESFPHEFGRTRRLASFRRFSKEILLSEGFGISLKPKK